MARTADTILKETIGDMVFNQSTLVAQVEALKARVIELEARYEPKPPTSEPSQA